MDNLQIELAKLRRDANLTESIEDVDKILEQLEAAREQIVQGENGISLPVHPSSLELGYASASISLYIY